MSLPSPTTDNRSVSPVDLGLLLFLGAVWGGVFLFMRIAAPEVGPVWAAEARIGIAAVVLAVVAGRSSWKALRGHLLAIAVVGVTFSAIPFSLIAFATLTLPAGLAALLNAATPLFTAGVGIAFLGQRLSGRVLAGVVVGMAAVLVLVGWSRLEASPATVLAVAAALGAALSYAFAGTFVRRALPGIGGVEIATGQLVSGSLALLPFAIASGAPGTPSPVAAVSLVAVALISTALAWPLYFRVLAHTTPTAASTVTFVVPAFGITWGALVLGEPIGPGLVAGFALIMVSLVLVLGLPVDRLAREAADRTARTVRTVLATRGASA